MSPLRIALAGAGAFGIKHLEALAKIDGVTVTSLVGRQRGPTEEVARKFGDRATWPTDLARERSCATTSTR